MNSKFPNLKVKKHLIQLAHNFNFPWPSPYLRPKFLDEPKSDTRGTFSKSNELETPIIFRLGRFDLKPTHDLDGSE